MVSVPVTSVDIDPVLLEAAKKALGVSTTKAAVTRALEESVMRRRQADAIRTLAGLDLDLDAEKITYDADDATAEA